MPADEADVPEQLSHLQTATRQAVLDGPGSTESSLRREIASGRPPPELDVLVRKIRDHAYTVTDSDVDALRARYSEDQLFELVIAAALGAAELRLKAALAALEDA